MAEITVNLKSKRACVFGLPGEGKSNFTAWLIKQYGSAAFIYDTMHEFPRTEKYDIYRPKNRYDTAEFGRIMQAVIKRCEKEKKYKLLCVDEANLYFPSKPARLEPYAMHFNDCCRHKEYGNVTPVYIARRPVQLNQDIRELCHYWFIFNLAGFDDVDLLNRLRKGLGDVVFNLPQYHFVVVNQRREYQVCKPVPFMHLDS